MKDTNEEVSGGAPETAGEAPALPAAANIVANSDVREGDAAELVRLKRQLEDSEARRKSAELRGMELEDHVRTLTTPPTAPPAKVKRSPNTFFDDYEGAD